MTAKVTSKANQILIWKTLIFAVTLTWGATPFRKTLISVEENIWVENWEIKLKDVLGADVAGEVRKSVLRGGKQDGVDVVRVHNGRLGFEVIPTRGMSVRRVEMGKMRLAWDSPVKETVHPKFMDLGSRGGLGWLEGFNEWMVRCGLEWAGHPGSDEFISNTGDKATMELSLHGKIGNIPASEAMIIIDDDPPHRIRIRGRVDERMFYGPQLELRTEISTEPGSNEFRISDTITNVGTNMQEFQIIYHCNYGSPLLEAGSHFLVPVRTVSPFNENAARGIDSYRTYRGPTHGFIEQVYLIEPLADATGHTTIMLTNSPGDRGAVMNWSLAELPYLTQWKNTADLKAGYVTGLEPGTGYPYNRRTERKFGRVPKLNPGESRSFTIDFALLDRQADVTAAAAAIQKIQGRRGPEIKKIPLYLGEE